MSMEIPKEMMHVECNPSDYLLLKDRGERRLYLYGDILSIDDSDNLDVINSISVTSIVESIFDYNRADKGVPASEREPIRLYINSPGGDVIEGFSLISAISLSKTPIYTINVGQWSSMSFLIGIAGDRRFSLPNSIFLLHDGSSSIGGSNGAVQDRAKFFERFDREIVRSHVLRHSKMSGAEYDALARIEYYMLPMDAKEHGFIDEIVVDMDSIL